MKNKLTIVLGSDHGGLELKNSIIKHLESTINITLIDVGTDSTESTDYPDYAKKAVKTIQENNDYLGILCCGTGIGMSIMANRYPGIRAALVHNEFTAQMAKEHNNANIVCLGARTTDAAIANKLVDIWLSKNFEGGRHQRRVDKLDQL
ncbi:ribose 5-phosphate isomerase B [Candidatus Margulisiibacteriota bacterium]